MREREGGDGPHQHPAATHNQDEGKNERRGDRYGALGMLAKPSAAGPGRCVILTPGFFCAPPVTERVVPLQAFVNPAYFFGRMASAVPWMKAVILVTSSSESLPVKSGMPRSMNGPLNTMSLRLAMVPGLA